MAPGRLETPLGRSRLNSRCYNLHMETPTTERWFLGIDPGKTGGLAVVNCSGTVYEAHPMPATRQDTYRLLARIVECRRPLFAIVEKVGPMPKQGVTSMFTFGQNYERPLAILTCLGVRCDEVDPKSWQQALGVSAPKAKTRRKKGDPKPTDEEKKAMKVAAARKKREHKLKLLAKAQALFPDAGLSGVVSRDGGRGDSLLLAEFLRRREVAR